jgi:hypothetical protein
MGRKRRSSPKLEKAEVRLQSIKSISATLDLGNGLSITSYESLIDAAQSKLDEYNQLLASLDEKSATLRDKEKQLGSFSERMLAGVAAKYGKDSPEYAQAGGIRRSDIKRPANRAGGSTGAVSNP